MQTQDESFAQAVQTALYTFQMLEQGLKVVISLLYDVTTTPLKENFREGISKAPLGQLRKMYLKISTNTALAEDIKTIQPWRDFCAHRAYAAEFMNRSIPDQKNEFAGVLSSTVLARSILETIQEEILQLQSKERVS